MMINNRKGIATWIIQTFTAFFSVAMVVFLYFLLYGRYFDLHAIVIGHETQRHAINIAQVILSSDDLVYEEYVSGLVRYHRGVLDRNKLDIQMMSENKINIESSLSEEIGYPSTGMQIVVIDMETDEKWTLGVGGPGLENQKEFLTCLNDNLDFSLFGMIANYPFRLWNYWDWDECWQTYETKTGVYEGEFPVLIKDGTEMHPGRLFVRVVEL